MKNRIIKTALIVLLCICTILFLTGCGISHRDEVISDARYEKFKELTDGGMSKEDANRWLDEHTDEWHPDYKKDASDKKEETEKPAGMETASAPAVAEKIIVFGSPDGLHALDRETLEKLWHFKPGKALIPSTPYHRRGYPEVSATPVIAGDKVICGALDGKLYVLELTSGKVLWQAQLDSQIMAQAAVSGNAVVVVTLKGSVYLFTSK